MEPTLYCSVLLLYTQPFYGIQKLCNKEHVCDRNKAPVVIQLVAVEPSIQVIKMYLINVTQMELNIS